MKPTRVPQAQQCGAASLIIVVILLAAMAVAVAYTNRNLVFEQRTAANQYRATIAAEAAEAGLDWAMAMLNKTDKIDASCAFSAGGGSSVFRDRYFQVNNNTGELTRRDPTNNIHVACVSNAATDTDPTWSCSCPVAGTAATPAASAPTTGYQPGFAVVFENNAAVAGTARIRAFGCTGPISSDTCAGDATAMATVLAGPIPTLGTPPAAPLTARGSVNFQAAAVTIVNTDPTANGITVNAGLGIDGNSNARVITVPGTPPKATLVGNDPSLGSTTEEEMFKSFFNMTKTDYKALDAVTKVTCPCTQDTLTAEYNKGNRSLWLDGDLTMNANSEIGTDALPVSIIVDGNVTISAGTEIYGLIYSTALVWNQIGGGNALVKGAAISEGNYTGTGTPAFVYDAAILRRLRNSLNAYARVPGSWRDYNP